MEEDPDAPIYQEEPPQITEVTGEIQQICEHSGNKFDGWWYALLGMDELDVAAAGKGRDDLTLAGLEEQATSGNFYCRVPF